MQLIKFNAKILQKVLIFCFFLFNAQITYGQHPEIKDFIGTWMRDGRIVLIVKEKGDFLSLEDPESAKWSMQIENIQVKDGKLTFEKNYINKDGSNNHYYIEIRENPDGIMMQRLSATPSFEKANDNVLIKLENYPNLAAHPKDSASVGVRNYQLKKNDINIMEFILFLNANQANNGAASFKADHEKKMLQYFDSDGRVFEESFIDQNNDIVTKEYDQDGQVLSEIKITQSYIEETLNKESDYGKEIKRVAKAALFKLATAAENYKSAHAGQYPVDVKNLIGKTQELQKDYCSEGMRQYTITCDFRVDGYTLTARPRYFDTNPGNITFRMTTGKILEEIDPGERLNKK